MKRPLIRYEIDPHNRLIIEKTRRRSDLNYFREVLDGRFEIGPRNSLIYHVKAPAGGAAAGRNAPHQVKLRGVWSLTGNHDLRITLDKWRRQTFGDQLTLRGEIIDVDKNSLLFTITTRSKENTGTTYALKLEGTWRADKNNRLTFRVNKENQKHDILTFDGIWEIGKNYQIIYQYKKSRLARKKDAVHTLILKGQWDVTDKARISYIVDKNTESVFNFKTSLGIFREDYIKYEVGIGASDRPKPVKRTITLFGRWNLKRDVGLTFEAEYENKKISAITFGAEAKLTDRDTARVRLLNNNNEDTGIEMELTHEIHRGDGQAFLRLLKSKKEAAIYAGAAWRW